jgi:methionyl-tRNA formyltransferase
VRILFMGTAELAYPCLETVAGQTVLVITQPDRPKGRHLELAPPPVKVTAGKLGLTVSQPAKVRDAVEEIRAGKPDLIIVVAYGQILPKAILEIPPLGCINVHASLLPRWRGASPIQHAILHGDHETGVTTMFINEKMDAGDIILQRAEPIRSDDTAGTLHDRLAPLGAKLLAETLSGNFPRRPQDESQVTHARKLTKEDGRVDWARPVIEIERQIRAMNPWPSAFAYLGDLMVKLWKAEVVNGELRLLEVQPANGKRMSYEAFLRGHPEALAKGWD